MYGHKFFNRSVASAVVLAAFVSIAILMPASPSRAASDVKIEWLTWGLYRITSPGGKVILINPWYANPDSSFTLDDIPEGDIILITSGHGDEIGNTLEIGAKTGATIVASHEVIAQKFREAGAGFFDPIKFNGAEIPARATARVEQFGRWRHIGLACQFALL